MMIPVRPLKHLFGLLILVYSISLSGQQDADKQSDIKVAFNENVYVIGKECIGPDCVDGESLAFTTIRLKENNPRIEFEDTSTLPNFPSNDWHIKTNDSFLGGLDYFEIKDITNDVIPFYIAAGATDNALYVDDIGQVGIGTNSPSKKLHVIGDGLITGELDVLSDRRLKESIIPLEYAQHIISRLNVVSYKMKFNEYPDLGLPHDQQYGLLAQELQKQLPELVSGDEAGAEWMSINYTQLVPILIKANQEQQSELDTLRSTINSLVSRIEQLEKR